MLRILQRYILSQFFSSLFLCLFGSTALFMIFDFFEKTRVFIREDATIMQATSYLFFKVPLIVHLMTPVSVLVATLFTIGRMSQHAEITALRGCGVSVFSIATPLLSAGLGISLLVFLAGESIVPWTTQRVDEIYHFDIKKKIEKGTGSRSDFWYRSANSFLNIGFYDSRTFTLKQLSILAFDENFNVRRRTDAEQAIWKGPNVGWLLHNVVETTYGEKIRTTTLEAAPLVIPERPEDFLQIERQPEAMTYAQLAQYVEKLRAEGVPVSRYVVQLAAKISFPLVNVIVILIAFPFSLRSPRTGTMTRGFVAAVAIGFGYYFVHAFSTSLGTAELLPAIIAAWTANILFGLIGSFFMAGVDRA